MSRYRFLGQDLARVSAADGYIHAYTYGCTVYCTYMVHWLFFKQHTYKQSVCVCVSFCVCVHVCVHVITVH